MKPPEPPMAAWASPVPVAGGTAIEVAAAGPPLSLKPKPGTRANRVRVAAADEATAPLQEATAPPAPAPTSYTKIEGTRLEQVLKAGVFQVVKGQYFADRCERGERIQMCQDIPPEYVWEADEAVRRWRVCGHKFLVAVSYSWLQQDHPDPEAFHLKTLAELVNEHYVHYPFVGEIGIIIDYCSLPQHRPGQGCVAAERERLQAGLEEIHALFGHTEVMSWRLEQVPEGVARKYDDRGWTLLERTIVDGKATNLLEGGPNVRVRRSEAEGEVPSDPALGPVAELPWRRGPVLTPERFEQELQRRGRNAYAKGVAWFTNGKEDLPLVRRQYREAFTHLSRARGLEYVDAQHWGREEAEALLEALPSFRNLWCLRVLKLPPESGALLARGVADLLNVGELPRIWIVDVDGAINGTDEESELCDARTRRRGVAKDVWLSAHEQGALRAPACCRWLLRLLPARLRGGRKGRRRRRPGADGAPAWAARPERRPRADGPGDELVVEESAGE